MATPTPASAPAVDGSPRAARRERRNWALRNLFVSTKQRGPFRFWPAVALVIAAASAATGAWLGLRGGAPARVGTAEVPYSAVATALTKGAVARIVVEKDGAHVTATLRWPAKVDGREVTTFLATVPAKAVSLHDLERWAASGAAVRVIEAETFSSRERIAQGASLLLVIGLAGYLLARHRSITRPRFMVTPAARRLSLRDVGGAREAQADLRDVIAFLRDPRRFEAMGARSPKGVLLVGPPGTGKTLLARAVAGEAGCPLIIAAGSDFNEMYVGVGSRRVRALAKQARDQAPCIVFIDEFDSLGGRRGRPNRSSEEEVTLNQLLVEMDGMAGSEGVIWMAATNREDMLDPAVRRPGRFDRVVEVPLPTAADRLEILRIHARTAPLAPDVDLERLAQLTVGHSGAELANLLNEAAIVAVHARSTVIASDHIEQARDKILLGRVRAGVVVSDDERRLIALHEAGHAVVGIVACPDDRLHKVTIEPRGRSLGAAHFAPEADRHLHSRRYLEGIIAKALGGRAAELVFLGPDAVTSGAGSDLVHATSVARRMVGEFGMSDEVGLVSADPAAHGGAPSSALQSQIDGAARTLIKTQADRAERIVEEHRAAVDAIAGALLERDVLAADDVYAIAERHGVPVPLPRRTAA